MDLFVKLCMCAKQIAILKWCKYNADLKRTITTVVYLVLWYLVWHAEVRGMRAIA